MTSLDTAVADVTKLGFDTSPFIYFIERNPSYLPVTREIFRRVDTGAFVGYSSTITVTEVLVHPKKRPNRLLEREYRDLLLYGRNFTLISIDVDVAESAAELRARYNLRTPDALQIAAARHASCEAFPTNDLSLQRVTELLGQ